MFVNQLTIRLNRKFLEYLMEVYGSEAKIIDHANTWRKSDLVAIIRTKLMIAFNLTYLIINTQFL